ncbi:MAG: trigger factor [Anaerolineae bacterium]|nr:trigger factor [Anaerolineae bacterium]
MEETLTISQETLENRQIALNISVAPQRVEEAMRRAGRKISQRGRIPGFRPGKAPYAVVLRTYGRKVLLEEAAEDLIPVVFEEATKQAGIEPYAQPALTEMKTEPMNFKFVVPIRPVVELGDYKSLRVPWEPPVISEERVQETLDTLRRQQGQWEPVEKAADYSDLVTLDIAAKVGEETLLDQREWDHILSNAQGGFIPGFDAAFVGKVAGDEWDFDLRYPDDSPSRWKGQTANFHAKVLTVKSRSMPELDDAFAQKVGEYKDLAELQQKLREELEGQAKAQAEADYTEQVLTKLVEGAQIEFPPALLDEGTDEVLRDQDRRLRERGSSLAAFLQLNKKSETDYREEVRPQAERRVKRGLAMGRLAELEGIEVTDADLDSQVEEYASGLTPEGAENWRELMARDESRRYMRNDLLTERTLARLRAIARNEIEAAPEAAPAENPEGL